jgi:transcriptional regulator with XRE-family HTH domain
LLGERLVELRKERKLTQSDVAKRLHLTRSTYAQYEVDRRVPEYATLQKLADFYDVSIDYLVGRTDDRKKYNDANTTIKLIEGIAEKWGYKVDDPDFLKMLANAFDLLNMARGKSEK